MQACSRRCRAHASTAGGLNGILTERLQLQTPTATPTLHRRRLTTSLGTAAMIAALPSCALGFTAATVGMAGRSPAHLARIARSYKRPAGSANSVNAAVSLATDVRLRAVGDGSGGREQASACSGSTTSGNNLLNLRRNSGSKSRVGVSLLSTKSDVSSAAEPAAVALAPDATAAQEGKGKGRGKGAGGSGSKAAKGGGGKKEGGAGPVVETPISEVRAVSGGSILMRLPIFFWICKKSHIRQLLILKEANNLAFYCHTV